MKKLFFLFFLVFFSNCSKDEIGSTKNTTSEVKDFIWKKMNSNYLWQSEVSNLADDRFRTPAQYSDFIYRSETPKEFFKNLLYVNDRFSYLTEDYLALQKSFSGVTKSNGMHYNLSYHNNSSNIFGYVTYVAKNSDAKAKGVKRGMIFTAVDGKKLTKTNYQQLLGQNSYTISLAALKDSTLTSTSQSISLTKVIDFSTPPIFIHKVFDKGTHKIGYLMYNQFISNYNNDLNNIFAEFKSKGVTDLILDLRYNPGGSVSNAVYLASMITGQFANKLYIEYLFNNKLKVSQNRKINFATSIGGTHVNSLGLNKIYILATSRSASASELTINGLKAYINVQHIGTTTVGKYTASITIYDSPTGTEKGVNQSHTYAIQPLILKIANANGVTDFYNGLTPNIFLKEDLANMGMLGDETEPMLAKAIEKIMGGAPLAYLNRVTPSYFVEAFSSSNDFELIPNEMYINKDID